MWWPKYFPITRQSQCNGNPAVTSTTYDRNIELLCWNPGGYIVHMYYERNVWSYGGEFGSGDIDGYPAFIQSNFDIPGNFESVVRHKDGSLQHWWRHDKSRSLSSLALLHSKRRCFQGSLTGASSGNGVWPGSNSEGWVERQEHGNSPVSRECHT